MALLLDKKSKGAQIRSRANWIEQGEKNSSYFLRLESQRQSCNTIKQLKCGNDDIFTNNDDILKNMCDFYQTLYNSTNVKDSHIIEYLRNVHIEHILSDEEKNLLDSPLTIDECRSALFDMQNRESTKGYSR